MATAIKKASLEATTLGDDTIKEIVRISIMCAFEQAADAFKERPSAHNWARLEACMWAVQAVADSNTLNKALEGLKDLGVGRWIDHLRVTHERG